jgi:VIT1/CCC1 family predicted Fe2+/Mn2+ transporter
MAPETGSIRLFDQERVRELVVDTNDGIMAIAGIAEGFIGAGASSSATMIAVLAGSVAGSIALAAAKFAEASMERDARQVVLDEERRQLELSPEEELRELAALYEAKGLTPSLAHQVAHELTLRDALAAHANAEHGIEPDQRPIRPFITAALAGLAFMVGALVVVVTILTTPRSAMLPTTFIAVALSLVLTSLVLAHWGHVPVARTITRNVCVGMTAMLVSLAIGSLFDL